MADEVRTYRHTREVEEGGASAVAIVAIVLVVLVAIVLTVVYWDNIFGTAPSVIERNTIITDNEAAPTNTITNNREVIRDSSSERTIIMPSEDSGSTGSSSTATSTETSGSTGTTY